MMKFLILMIVLNQGLFADVAFTAGAPIDLVGAHGFDFIKIDAPNRRLLACHTGNHSLDVIDIDSSKLIKSIPTGAAQGVAIDEKNGRYFVSVSKPPQMVIIDSKKLESTGEVPLDDPADLVTYDAGSNRVFVCNDEKPILWIIDPEVKKILLSQSFPGEGMEDLSLSPDGKYLWQNLKNSNAIAKYDITANTIVGQYPTAPSEKPHGLAMVPESAAVLVVGGTGKLSLISLDTGKILSFCDVAPKVDEISYDLGVHQVYCASGTGVISVASVVNNTLTNIGTITSTAGTHSVAVDPKTHAVWIVYAKGTQSFAQAFVPSK